MEESILNKALIKEDLYEAVNGEWIKEATIPADKPATGGFQDLVDGIDELLMADTKNEWGRFTHSQWFDERIHCLLSTSQWLSKTDQDGAAPMLPLLKRVEDVKDLTEIEQQLTSWVLDGLPLPFGVDVDADMKNTKINALFAGAPSLILPDKTYYEAEHPQAPQLLAVFKEMTMKLLNLQAMKQLSQNKSPMKPCNTTNCWLLT